MGKARDTMLVSLKECGGIYKKRVQNWRKHKARINMYIQNYNGMLEES